MGVAAKRTRTKTRRRTRDLDQAKADLLSPRHLELYKETKATEDLPGSGLWYCVECSRWFDAESTLSAHKRSKPHKRRVKMLQEEPYTQKEAEAAVGLRTDNGNLRKKGENGCEVEMIT
ncbi:hypothetical protein VUR80DRAFT_6095 [Thermomyces stellatus]